MRVVGIHERLRTGVHHSCSHARKPAQLRPAGKGAVKLRETTDYTQTPDGARLRRADDLGVALAGEPPRRRRELDRLHALAPGDPRVEAVAEHVEHLECAAVAMSTAPVKK